MEYAPNAGLDWRREVRKKLSKLGVVCIIPNEEEKDLVPDNFVELKKLDLIKYKAITRCLIERDLRFVEAADFIIVKWEGEKMAGTIHECGYAYQLDKPVYLITSKPLEEVPGWFLSCSSYTFHDINEFVKWYRRELWLTMTMAKEL